MNAQEIIPATWSGDPKPLYNIWEGPRDPEVQEAIKAGLSKEDFVAQQWREVIQGSIPKVTCECGLNMPLRFAFRCLYCGQWYCAKCAENHFGKTRQQYREENRGAS